MDLLELKDCIITIDAMGCQKEIAQKIVNAEADYAFGLKGNQGTLHEDVKLYFEDEKASFSTDIYQPLVTLFNFFVPTQKQNKNQFKRNQGLR